MRATEGAAAATTIAPPATRIAPITMMPTARKILLVTAAARGRLGLPRCLEYALGSAVTWLPYIMGGLSVGEVQAWDALTPSSGQAFRGGWTVGAGVETLRAPNWSIFIWILGPRNYLMSSPVLPKRRR